MRNVSFKNTTLRTATARSELVAKPSTIELIQSGNTPKGDPVPVAKVAAIQATKKTPEWIPYCHNIPIEHVDVQFKYDTDRIAIEVYVESVAKTGVEMEAITAAAAAAITIYDMLKICDDTMEISSIQLLQKTGGKSQGPKLGKWQAQVIVASDRASRGEYEDESGLILVEGLQELGATHVHREIVADDDEAIRSSIAKGIEDVIDIIIVTGGTGIGPRDVTSNVVMSLIELPLPGVVSAYQQYSQSRVTTAMLARPLAGVAANSIILAIPGSPGACRDALAALFPALLHAKSMLLGEAHS